MSKHWKNYHAFESLERFYWGEAILAIQPNTHLWDYYRRDPEQWIAATLANPTPGGTLKQIIAKYMELRMKG